jgi:hypothetical protein
MAHIKEQQTNEDTAFSARESFTSAIALDVSAFTSRHQEILARGSTNTAGSTAVEP